MASFNARSLLADNRRMLGKLLVVTLLMFGFGYALVPMYRAICEALGVNVL
jgi:cytochrome c oxidase assembly protein subunit 11